MKIQDIEAMNSKTYITDGGDKRSASTSELILGGVAVIGILGWALTVNAKNNAVGMGYLNSSVLNGRLQDQQFNLLYCNSNQGVTAINGMPTRGNTQIV